MATLRVLRSALVMGLIAGYGQVVMAIGPDNYGYTAVATTLNFEDLTVPGFNPVEILDTENDTAVTIPIGFSFKFYGATYTSVSVSSNGLLTFGNANTSAVPVDLSKTAPTVDVPTIAVFWHDWTFQYLGSDEAYYQTLGMPGSRRLIVQWNFALSNSGPGNDTVTFEAKLFEGSNKIEFHYNDATVDDDVNVSNGTDATVGIRAAGGQGAVKRYLQWSFNKAVIADSSALQFIAPAFRVSSIQRLSNGHMLLQCVGEPNVSNTIQASTNLVTFSPFVSFSMVADATGSFQFEDASPGLTRFYRILVP